MLEQSRWIWSEEPAEPDSYAEFYDVFDYSGGDALLHISCDSNYAVYLNGDLAAFGQYADFEHYKIADTVDLKPYCRAGSNHFAVVVWYYGAGSSTYCPGRAGVIFDIDGGSRLLLKSGPATRARRSRAYRSGEQKWITRQLGFSFCYDRNAEDGWMTGGGRGFRPSVIVDKPARLLPRPNRKLVLRERTPSTLLSCDRQTRFLFDLQKETAGLLELELFSDRAQRLTIAYGEHLRDGHVARIIGDRDFSVTVIAAPGDNRYLNPFRRLGCRYLELFCEAPVQIGYVGLRPTDYPLRELPFAPADPLDREIYRICVETLRLCLHEHYEDCPWREQAFYTMDSRNQMLCGYFAFGEFEAARAGLQLFAQDRSEDGLLAICCPKEPGQCIPSFSLHYFTAVDEYTRYSGDTTLAAEVYGKLEELLDAFLRRERDGLVPVFEGKNYWNFYEWREELDGYAEPAAAGRPDLILNCLLVLALEHMATISAAVQKDGGPYRAHAARIRDAVRRAFYRADLQAFSTFDDRTHVCELGNALAILCGAATEPQARRLAERLAAEDGEFVPATLSMNCFVFDALLQVDRGYRASILSRIRRQYRPMLEQGSTTVWEDEEGAEAFDRAGSLCHGWSALPIYYDHLFARWDA